LLADYKDLRAIGVKFSLEHIRRMMALVDRT